MLHVRPAVVEDAEGVSRVHVAGWQRAYRGVLADDYLDGLRWSDWFVFWSGELTEPELPGSVTWVAVRDDDVVGFAGVGPSRDEDLPSRTWQELYAMYVMPDSWGTGIGSLLMQYALGEAPPHVRQMSLWVLAANQCARSFYERHGFVADGRELTIEIGGQQVDEVRYRRAVGPN